MAVTLRNTSAVATGSTSLTIDKPTNTVDGDIMIMVICVHDTTSKGTLPAGWTRFAETSSTNGTGFFAWKRASGEGASYSVTGLADSSAGFIVSFYNCIDSGNPIDASVGRANASGATGTAGITTTTANCMIVSAECVMDNYNNEFSAWACATNPASLTELTEGGSNTGSDTCVGGAYAIRTGSGATGASSCTFGTAFENVGLLCAIKPQTAFSASVVFSSNNTINESYTSDYGVSTSLTANDLISGSTSGIFNGNLILSALAANAIVGEGGESPSLAAFLPTRIRPSSRYAPYFYRVIATAAVTQYSASLNLASDNSISDLAQAIFSTSMGLSTNSAVSDSVLAQFSQAFSLAGNATIASLNNAVVLTALNMAADGTLSAQNMTSIIAALALTDNAIAASQSSMIAVDTASLTSNATLPISTLATFLNSLALICDPALSGSTGGTYGASTEFSASNLLSGLGSNTIQQNLSLFLNAIMSEAGSTSALPSSTKWRLYITSDGYAGLSTFEMHGTFGGADQCSGGTATASHTYGSGWEASKAFDGNTGTSWLNTNSAPSWIQYEFASAVSVAEYVLAPRHDDPNQCPRAWQLQYYDGAIWQTLDSQVVAGWSSNVTRTYWCPTVPYSAFRFQCTTGNHSTYCGIGTMEIHSTVGGSDICNGNAKASCSTAYDITNWGPEKTIDNDNSTFWLSSGSMPQGLQVTFSSAKTIAEYKISTRQDSLNHSPQAWTFQYWDGSAWQTWDTQSGWTTWETNQYTTCPLSNKCLYRLNISESNDANYTGLGTLEMHTAVGGADQCSGGNWRSSTQYDPTHTTVKAFDNDNSSSWVNSTAMPQWIYYQFPTARNIVEYKLSARQDSLTQSPKAWTFEYWDGETWQTIDTQSNQTGWTLGEYRTFTTDFPEVQNVGLAGNMSISGVGSSIFNTVMGLSTNSAVSDGGIASLLSSYNLANNARLTDQGVATLLSSYNLVNNAQLTDQAVATFIKSLALAGNATLLNSVIGNLLASALLVNNSAVSASQVANFISTVALPANSVFADVATGNYLLSLLIASNDQINMTYGGTIAASLVMQGNASFSLSAAGQYIGTLLLSDNATLSDGVIATYASALTMQLNGTYSAFTAGTMIAALTCAANGSLQPSALGQFLLQTTLTNNAALADTVIGSLVSAISLSANSTAATSTMAQAIASVALSANSTTAQMILRTTFGTASLTGNNTLISATIANYLCSSDLSADTSIIGIGELLMNVALALSGNATVLMNVQGMSVWYETLNLAGTAELSNTTIANYLLSLALSLNATTADIGRWVTSANLPLQNNAVFSESATALLLGSILLNDNATFSDAATATIGIAANLIANGRITAEYEAISIINAALALVANGQLQAQAFGNFVMALLIAGSSEIETGAAGISERTLDISANAVLANAVLRQMIALLDVTAETSFNASAIADMLSQLSLATGTEVTVSTVAELFAGADLNALAALHAIRPSAVKMMFMSLLHLNSTLGFIMKKPTVTVGMKSADTEITTIKEE